MLLSTPRLTVALQVFSSVRQQCCQCRYRASQCAATQFGASQLAARKPQLCMNQCPAAVRVGCAGDTIGTLCDHFACSLRQGLFNCDALRASCTSSEHLHITSFAVHVASVVDALRLGGLIIKLFIPRCSHCWGIDATCTRMSVDHVSICNCRAQVSPLAADAGCYLCDCGLASNCFGSKLLGMSLLFRGCLHPTCGAPTGAMAAVLDAHTCLAGWQGCGVVRPWCLVCACLVPPANGIDCISTWAISFELCWGLMQHPSAKHYGIGHEQACLQPAFNKSCGMLHDGCIICECACGYVM